MFGEDDSVVTRNGHFLHMPEIPHIFRILCLNIPQGCVTLEILKSRKERWRNQFCDLKKGGRHKTRRNQHVPDQSEIPVQSLIDFREMCQRMSAPRGKVRNFVREAFDI